MDNINKFFEPLASQVKSITGIDFIYVLAVLLAIIVVFLVMYPNILNNLFKQTKNLVGGNKEEITFTLYYVEWCPHCKVVKPEWDKLENDPELEHIKIVKINCEENEEIVQEKNIEGFPTILLNNNGKEEAYNGNREYAEFKNYLLEI
jgi:thiol-disulfide isomerase/thioredoxin